MALDSVGSLTKCVEASNTWLHWPQRTQPSEILSWSGTTLNKVLQDGQRVTSCMENYSKGRLFLAVIKIQPSSVSATCSCT